MEKIESGKSIEEVKASLQRGLELDEFHTCEFEILQEPTRGFLGIGAKEAKVKMIVKTDKIRKSQHLFQEMIRLFGFSVTPKSRYDEQKNTVVFSFSGSQKEEFEKQFSSVFSKIEVLLHAMINRKDRDDVLRISIEGAVKPEFRARKPRFQDGDQRDGEEKRTPRPRRTREVASEENSQEDSSREQRSPRLARSDRPPRKEGGERREKGERGERRERRDYGDSSRSQANPVREQFLITMARNMANKVLETKKPVKLNPMNSYDRRIIHNQLNDVKNIRTVSEGDGENRRVVIEYVE